MANFVVDENGFQTPRFPEARARVVELWRSVYGDDADTGETSPDGLMITTMALLLALVWQGVGASSSNSFLRTARGIFVDRILDLFGRRRLQPVASTASLVWYGTDATIVTSGAQARNAASSTFATDEAATIGAGDLCAVARFSVNNATLYRITVDAVNYDYTSDGSATRAEIVAGLLAELAALPAGAAYDGGDDPDGRARIVIELEAAGVFAGNAAVTVFDAVRVAATATATGPLQALAGTVNVIVNPIAGVQGVTTTADAVVGRSLETDAAMKARHLANLSANGARSPEAIAARLMDEDEGVEGVEIARVFENETLEFVGLRPPKSFETFVLGGDDDEIAALIWNQKPGGIQAYGTTEIDVTGTDGRLHRVGFSRPEVLYLHLRITVTPGEGYPSTGTPLTTIRDAVAAFFGDGGVAELQLGQNFYRFAVGQPAAAAVPGIASLVVETDTTPAPDDVPTFAGDDVDVDEGQILRLDATRVTVQV